MGKVVDCHGLSKTYRTGTVALDGLDFSVEKGAIHGLGVGMGPVKLR